MKAVFGTALRQSIGFGESLLWNACKNGGPRRRVLRKIHIGIDGKTF